MSSIKYRGKPHNQPERSICEFQVVEAKQKKQVANSRKMLNVKNSRQKNPRNLEDYEKTKPMNK